MKKIILIAGLLLSGLAQAQDPIIEVTGKNDEVITDGYVYETNSLEVADSESGGYLPLHVTNLTDEAIYVKLRMVSFENADGNGDSDEIIYVQFCFGTLCYFAVEEGNIVPSNITQAKIEAGSHNPNGDKFTNAYPGDVVGEPVTYNMELVQFSAEGVEIGPLVSFTFKYTPTAGTNDLNGLNNIGISVKNTVVKNQLDIDAQQNAKLELFTISGQQVKTVAIQDGSQSIDLSGLSAAV
jgi:hypothetical protein